MNCRKTIARDGRAGVEGLPLQLLIMVVIAGLGLTILMGWMSSISGPRSIGEVYVTPGEIAVFDADGDGLYVREGMAMTVIVTDQSGDRLGGATVLLEGGNIRTIDGEPVRGVTDERGCVVFTDLVIEHFGPTLATITVTVAKGDYGMDSSFEIPVIPS